VAGAPALLKKSQFGCSRYCAATPVKARRYPLAARFPKPDCHDRCNSPLAARRRQHQNQRVATQNQVGSAGHEIGARLELLGLT
jgi:hypothetical protein